MNKQEMPELKPCPFCGGVAVIREDASHSTGVFFGCNTSGCLGADMWEESASEAISAWNTRADLPPPLAEAMRCPEVMALCLEVHTAMRNHGHALVNLRELRTTLAALEQAERHE